VTRSRHTPCERAVYCAAGGASLIGLFCGPYVVKGCNLPVTNKVKHQGASPGRSRRPPSSPCSSMIFIGSG
jgi:hypothetical protein